MSATPLTTTDLRMVAELQPAPTVASVALALAGRARVLVFDSAGCVGSRGRYSYVMADPSEWHTGSLASLVQAARAVPRRPGRPDLPPFQGGYAGLFGYGLSAEWEPTPAPRFDEFRVPSLAVGRYDRVVAFDHVQNRAWAIAPAETPARVFRAWVASLAAPGSAPLPTIGAAPELAPQHPLPNHPRVQSTFSPDGFRSAVARAIEYVHAGDVFQVNLAQRLLAPLSEPPFALWHRLRSINPAPFSAYFDLGPVQVISASPERFVEVAATGRITTRPIKGTRPRSSDPTTDAAILHELIHNPKDRAENVMIVDLLRNDLGKVAAVGSVQVPVICEPESFAFVHHLVSEVRAKLAPDCDVWDLLRAALPGGSVTGAPKVRAMQIIAELEPTARGAYCGSLGYVGFDGVADTNILIRTFTAAGGWLQFPVGGGIVADSDPHREYTETLHKAAGLLAALTP